MLTLEEKCAFGALGATHEAHDAKISAVEHHLTLERVERVMGDVSEGRRETAHSELLCETHGACTAAYR